MPLSIFLEEPEGSNGIRDLVRFVLLCSHTLDCRLVLLAYFGHHSTSGKRGGSPQRGSSQFHPNQVDLQWDGIQYHSNPVQEQCGRSTQYHPNPVKEEWVSMKTSCRTAGQHHVLVKPSRTAVKEPPKPSRRRFR